MRQKRRKKIGRVNFLSVIFLGLDIFFQSFFRIYDVGLENRGVTLGIFAEKSINLSALTFLILIIVFLYQYIKFKRFYFFMVLIVLGGIGNMFNRVIWGSVWDYICLPFMPFCFNLSDLLICFGVLSYILGINGNRDSLRRQ